METLAEEGRIQTLLDYQILDTEPEKHLDDLTRLLASICDTPIALITFVDSNRQWFKAEIGLDIHEIPRAQAFCSHTIQSDDIMVVEDASKDPRFVYNPLVTGAPNIRFYAGAPLKVANNHRLGTLCVIDQKPRILTEDQIEALRILRDAVVTNLELRKLGEWPVDILHVCAWCQKVRIEDSPELWEPIDSQLLISKPVTHGICPACQSEIIKDIQRQKPDI